MAQSAFRRRPRRPVLPAGVGGAAVRSALELLVARARQVAYSRDGSENTMQRRIIGESYAQHDGLRPLVRPRLQERPGSTSGCPPEPIYEHFVVINGRRWPPPKQVLALVTGLDRADFTTHQARRALTRLGFTAARSASPRGHHPVPPSAAAPPRPAASGTAGRPESLVEALRPFIGLWVAVRGDEGLVAAP